MVLAKGIELDILDNHHVVILLIEKGRLQDGNGILGIAACQFHPCPGHALGSLYESLTFGILAQQGEYGTIVCC